MNDNTNTNISATPEQHTVVVAALSYDVKNAILIVSIVANLIVLTTWIAIQVTSQYDYQLASLIFSR